MSYRSLKRVLGETNLERKCRWLFGICLFLLVFLAFWLVDRIGEDMVMWNIHRNGREAVRTFCFDKHWEKWETAAEGKQLQKELSGALLGERPKISVISLDPELVSTLKDADRTMRHVESGKDEPRLVGPKDETERALLKQLQEDFLAQLGQLTDATTGLTTDPQAKPTGQPSDGSSEPAEAFEPLYKSRSVPTEGTFYYYQPVVWNNNVCLSCHEGMYAKYARSAADTPLRDSSTLPFLVVRVALRDTQYREAINWTRSVLLAVGILTVSFAMVALWLVVRYVVVKPLTHLRDVSDSIAKGEMDVRADIHTNDEFEDLASSFNKMLRHMLEAQGELRTVNQDLDAKVDQLAQLNMRLHEMNRLKGEFLANMSHELRTPLNSIIGFSEVLQGLDSLGDKQKRYAHNIQKSGRLLLDMINDILDLAKMEAGKMDIRPSEFSIESLIQAQCDMVRSFTEEKNIDLIAEFEEHLPTLFQDQTKVQQILTNLLSNAIKFTPEGGRILVSARRSISEQRADGDQLEVAVADTGVGIAESDREIIFEKFRQGAGALGQDNLTREYSGTGLGLSIVKELCKLLGGEVTVSSELGKGSVFYVLLPWSCIERPQAITKLNNKLEELSSKPRRVDPEPVPGLLSR